MKRSNLDQDFSGGKEQSINNINIHIFVTKDKKDQKRTKLKEVGVEWIKDIQKPVWELGLLPHVEMIDGEVKICDDYHDQEEQCDNSGHHWIWTNLVW